MDNSPTYKGPFLGNQEDGLTEGQRDYVRRATESNPTWITRWHLTDYGDVIVEIGERRANGRWKALGIIAIDPEGKPR